MATSQGERGERERKTSSRKSGSSTALRDLAVSTVANVSTENILDLIEKLGVKDIVLSRVRARLETVDVDSLIDEAIDYVRRRPEVLVVTLGTITVAAALIVFLERRNDEFEFEIDDDDDDDFEEVNIAPIKSRGTGSTRPRSRAR